MSDNEEVLPSIARKRKRLDETKSQEKKYTYSFEDLKRFSQKTENSRKALAALEEVYAADRKTNRQDVEDNKLVLSQGKSLVADSISTYWSDVKRSYPGEKFISIRGELPRGSKTSIDFANDFKKGGQSIEETLFNAVAFSSSVEELMKTKTALRRVLESKSFEWKPKLSQFLGILSTAFCINLELIVPRSQADDYMEMAATYRQSNFISSKSEKRRFVISPSLDARELANLDAILDVLSWLDWESPSLYEIDEGSLSVWGSVLLILSLEIECRNRFDFQASIQNFIGLMVWAVRTDFEWVEFCKSIRSAIVSDSFGEPRHHHNMVHLCSLIATDKSRSEDLRSTAALECVCVLLSSSELGYSQINASSVGFKLIELLEQGRAEKKAILSDAYSLIALLELVQFILTPKVISSSSSDTLQRLTTFFQVLAKRRNWTTTTTVRMSATDAMFVDCMTNVIVDKMKVYGNNIMQENTMFYFKINDDKTTKALVDDVESEGATSGNEEKEDKENFKDKDDSENDDDEDEDFNEELDF